MNFLLRVLVFLVGAGVIGAMAHANIIASGGYSQPNAILTIAAAAGVITAPIALNLGVSWRNVLFIFITALCIEGFNLLNGADVVFFSRDAAQAPLREAATKHKNAELAVAEAKARVETAAAARPETARVTAAKAALDAANKAVMEQASAKNCLKNCAAMLTAAATAARQDLSNALAAADADATADRQKATAELAAAQRALLAAPMPASATPFADRTGIPPWAIDLVIAMLKSIGLNGLGAALIAAAVHTERPKQRRHEDLPENSIPRSITIEVPHRLVSDTKATKRGLMLAVERPKTIAKAPRETGNVVAMVPPTTQAGSVAKFLLDALEHREGSRVEIVDFFTNYRSWCSAHKLIALKVEAFNEDLAEALDIAGIETRKVRGRIYLIDVAFRDQLSVAI